MREQNGVCQSVRDVVLSAERMSDSVDISDIGFGKGRACEISGVQHIAACLGVIAVVTGAVEIGKDQLDGLDGIGAGFLRGGASDVRFDRMGEGIHTGGRGHVARQRTGDLRIEHRIARDKREVVDRILVARLAVGDDSGECRLAAGSGGRRNRNQRRQTLMYLENTLHLRQRLTWFCDARTDCFGTVDGRAAAESDDRLTVAAQVHRACLLDILAGRIGHRPVIDAAVDVRLVQAVLQRFGDAESADTGVCDEQNAGDILFTEQGGQFLCTSQQCRLAIGKNGNCRTEYRLEGTAIGFFSEIHAFSPCCAQTVCRFSAMICSAR